jgi:hypothetical protein
MGHTTAPDHPLWPIGILPHVIKALVLSECHEDLALLKHTWSVMNYRNSKLPQIISSTTFHNGVSHWNNAPYRNVLGSKKLDSTKKFRTATSGLMNNSEKGNH